MAWRGWRRLFERLLALLAVFTLIIAVWLGREMAANGGEIGDFGSAAPATHDPARFTAAERAAGWDRPVAHLHASETPVAEVVEELRRQTGAKVVVDWDELATYGIGRNEPVWAELNDVPLGVALREVFDGIVLTPVTYNLTADGIVVSHTDYTRDPPPADPSPGVVALVVRVYDVGELLEPFSPVPDPPPSSLFGNRSLFGGSVFPPPPPTSPRERATQELVQVLSSAIGLWEESPQPHEGRVVTPHGSRMIVVATVSEQKRIRDLIDGLKTVQRIHGEPGARP